MARSNVVWYIWNICMFRFKFWLCHVFPRWLLPFLSLLGWKSLWASRTTLRRLLSPVVISLGLFSPGGTWVPTEDLPVLPKIVFLSQLPFCHQGSGELPNSFPLFHISFLEFWFPLKQIGSLFFLVGKFLPIRGCVVGRVTFSTFFETLLWVVWNWMGMIKDSICQKFEVLNH